MDSDYWQKQDATNPLYPDILWSIPERRDIAGHLAVIGGNSAAIKTVADVTTAANQLGLGTVTTIIPDALHKELPHAPGLVFAESNDSGSFATGSLPTLLAAINDSNYTLYIGDLGKNSETSTVIAKALLQTQQPALITRDTIESVSASIDAVIERPDLTIFATLAQLQQIARLIHYPRPILLSQPLFALLETLHKLTITYPELTIATFHSGQYIVARDSQVVTTDIATTNYSPISLWLGPLATRIAAYQTWNPHKPLEAAVTAICETTR
jgi:hypothetical protein